MTDASAVGPDERALVAHLDELRELAAELRDELPHINDARLHPTIAAVVETAQVMLTAHGNDPKFTIADDLAGLMSAVRALRIPLRDPDLDSRTPTLDRLRKSKGLIVAGLADALDSAAAIGLTPQKPPIPSDVAAALPRSEIEGLLDGILRRLVQVEKSLNALDEAKSSPTNFTQQTGLLNFYTGSMRVEVDLAKLHLSVGEKLVDFNALARAVETMAGLTRDFVATVQAWTGRVAKQVIDIAREVPQRVRKVASGVRTSIRWVARTIRRRRVQVAAETAWSKQEIEIIEAGVPEPPPEFSMERVHEMILAGQVPPQDWMPLILEIDLSYTTVGDIAPLAGMANLLSLNLMETQVRDLAPLAGLANLQWLDLDGTQVSDLTPLARLANLQSLDLSETLITNLAPLSGLVGLQSLYVTDTQVSDLAPLAELVNLQSLGLGQTQVSDLAPLAGLAKLQSLDLDATQIEDLGSLAGLTNLQSLSLQGTQVSDLAPLAGLANLQSLNLVGTAVRNLTPLAGLANLQALDLQATQVNDFSAIAHVTSVTTPDGKTTSLEQGVRRRRRRGRRGGRRNRRPRQSENE